MFNFTQDERKVVLFLVAVILVGASSNCFLKLFSPARSMACFAQDLGKIDLNSADKKLLMKISGIGERISQQIIEYRDKHQGFSDLDELKEIKGINDSKFAKLKEYLTIK